MAATDPNYNSDGMNYLYIDKKDSSTGHNSIYVCYIPKAKSNRTVATTLYKPVLTGTTITGLIRAVPADFVGGYPDPAVFTFLTPATSMFKCVP